MITIKGNVMKRILEKLEEYFPASENYEILIEFYVSQAGYSEEELVIRVMTDKNVEESIVKLDKFDEEFWIDEHCSELCITMGYK